MAAPVYPILETCIRGVDENPLSTNFTKWATDQAVLRIDASVDAIVCNTAGNGFYSRTDFAAGTTTVEVGAQNHATPASGTLWLFARATEPGLLASMNAYILRIVYGAPDSLRISKMTAGATADLVSTNQEFGVGDNLCLQCVGTSLFGWYQPSGGGWSLLLSTSDASYASGRIGVGVSTVNPQMNNFGATTSLAVAGGTPSLALDDYWY